MYIRSFDFYGRLKTYPVGSDTRTLTNYAAASRKRPTPILCKTARTTMKDRLSSQTDNISFMQLQKNLTNMHFFG